MPECRGWLCEQPAGAMWVKFSTSHGVGWSMGLGGATCNVLCRAQSKEEAGGKELRATPARWLLSSPKEVQTSCCDMIHRTVLPVGWQGHFESKDYSLLMCERVLFYFFRLCEGIIRPNFISQGGDTWGEFKCTHPSGWTPNEMSCHLLGASRMHPLCIL